MGGLVGTCPVPPISPQDQFCNSSKFSEKMVGLGCGTSSKIFKWVGQTNYVLILGRGTQNPSHSAMAGTSPGPDSIFIEKLTATNM